MKALVTGAAGFLGSHLVESLLARGDQVVAFDHRLRGKSLRDGVLARAHGIEADVFDSEAVKHATRGCAAIFHCAAVVGVDAYVARPTRTMETEEIGLRNVCAAALAPPQSKPVVVFASSSAVYGHAVESDLVESLAVAPVSSYGIAKRFAELYLAAQQAEHGLRSASMRIFNIYGPRQDERLVLPRFIHRAMANEPLEIYGDGSQTRDFVFVGDVVAAMLAAASAVQGSEIINACSGEETAVLTLAQQVVAATGSRSAVVQRPRPAKRADFELERSVGSRAKAEALLGPLHRTPLGEGLARTVASMEQPRSDVKQSCAGD